MKQLEKYIKCINPVKWKQTIKENNGNLIFDINFKSTCSNQVKYAYQNGSQFKLSTKEAYDAQFVIKEDEFVLPEKWYIRRNKNNCVIINHYFKSTFINDCGPINKEGIIGTNGKTWLSLFDIYGYTEITFDQFKKYVLKKELEEPKDKVLTKSLENQIIQVESSEGAIYQLGDKIQIFGGSRNPAFRNKKYFTIQGFRWSNDKSKICAIFNDNFPNGIGLDKIELYSEPKQIVEDFVFPKNWCLEVNNNNSDILIEWRKLMKINDANSIKNYNYIANDGYGCFPHLRAIITFEQFKQHVLHNGFKIGDVFNKQKYIYDSSAIITSTKIITDLQYINNQSVAFFKIAENNYSNSSCRILTKNIVK